MENLIDFNLLKEYDSTLKTILGVWQKQKSYSVDDIIQYKGNYLKCTTAGTSGTTTLNFTGIEVGDTITDGTVVWEMIEPPSGSGNGLNDWVANTQYKIDSIVVNNGQIYKSLVEFISGSTFENIEILEDYELQTGDTPIPWAEDTEINTNDIVEYNSEYYKALYNFTCGSTFTKNVFEEYVPKSLTDEDIEDVIDAYEPVFSAATGVEYSTEEKRIGTWIDGKPLYQKTIVDTMPTVTTAGTRATKTIDISFIGIKKVINYSSIQFTSSAEYIPTNSVNIIGSSNSFSAISFYNRQYDINGVIDSIFLGSTRTVDSERPVYITLQYTKTTD